MVSATKLVTSSSFIGTPIEELFGRSYQPVESYRTEDAEVIFFMMGSFATKAKDAVDRLRSVGRKVGLLRPRLLRPFPIKAIVRALAGKKGIAVIDQNISLGKGGILHAELSSVLYSRADKPVIVSFIGGLGGRDITREEFYEMVAVTMKAIETGEVPTPRLLYAKEELIQMKGLQSIAKVEQRKGRGKR